VPATATEIVNSERQSFLTRAKKITYWTPALEQILEALLQIDAVHFEPHAVYRPRVEFADSVRDDPQQQASTVHVLRAAEAASAEVRVRLIHPKWSDQQVAKEVEAILSELVKPPPQTAPGGLPVDSSSLDAGMGLSNGTPPRTMGEKVPAGQ